MPNTTQLLEADYRDQFLGEKKAKALDRAWKNRDFEIELYWKRATYFWTFLVAAFAGYFAIIGNISTVFHQSEYIVSCLGFIFSLAWYFANVGSKKWQENWERHIDLLEEDVTGNIYKTVLDRRGFSVSGLNLKVSLYVSFIWVCLAVRYLVNNVSFKGSLRDIDWMTLIISLATLLFSLALLTERNGEKRRDFGLCNCDKISFSLRKVRHL